MNTVEITNTQSTIQVIEEVTETEVIAPDDTVTIEVTKQEKVLVENPGTCIEVSLSEEVLDLYTNAQVFTTTIIQPVDRETVVQVADYGTLIPFVIALA